MNSLLDFLSVIHKDLGQTFKNLRKHFFLKKKENSLSLKKATPYNKHVITLGGNIFTQANKLR